MKKISKWTFVGYIAGLFFTGMASLRYLVLWVDYDKAISYGVIGILICCVAWLYNKTKSLDNDVIAVENYLSNKEEKDGTTC